jgi:hypothetical protein
VTCEGFCAEHGEGRERHARSGAVRIPDRTTTAYRPCGSATQDSERVPVTLAVRKSSPGPMAGGARL